MRNSRGTTFIETILAVGIMTIVALSMATMKVNIANDFKKTQLIKDMNFLHVKIQRLLSLRSVCNASFGTQPLTSNPPIASLVTPDNNVIYGTASTYEGSILIAQMQVRNYTTAPSVPNEDQFQLAITYQIIDPVFLFGREITKEIAIRVRTTPSGTFEACFTPGYIGVDDEYINHFGPELRRGDLTILGELSVVRNPSDASGGHVLTEEYLQSSDANLKENIFPLSHSLSLLNGIQGYRYQKKSSGRLEYGFIAQEIENTAPIVRTDSNGFKSVKYQNLLAVQVEGTKDLQKSQKDLSQRIKTQKKKIRSALKEIKIQNQSH